MMDSEPYNRGSGFFSGFVVNLQDVGETPLLNGKPSLNKLIKFMAFTVTVRAVNVDIMAQQIG